MADRAMEQAANKPLNLLDAWKQPHARWKTGEILETQCLLNQPTPLSQPVALKSTMEAKK